MERNSLPWTPLGGRIFAMWGGFQTRTYDDLDYGTLFTKSTMQALGKPCWVIRIGLNNTS
jgi:hypothetical protein